ncbi:MAG: potassium/proton antiporter [Cyanobacteria bacterium P01_G01_bin.49]
MLLFEYFCLAASILILASVYASKFSNRFGVPALLLFLFIGMLAGSEGIGGIEFENYQLAQNIGDIALIFILFSGGLDTQWRRIRPVLWQGLTLSTLGVVLTMSILGTFAWLILGSFSSFHVGTQGISWLEGLLLGTIVSSTDAAAVFSLLKSSQINLKGNLQPLLELESGSNDPMAVLLTMTLVKLLATSEGSLGQLVLSLFGQIIIGTLMGYGMGRLMSWETNRLQINIKGLYSVAMIAKVLFTYGLTSIIQGNGFLAVYVAGIVAASRQFEEKESIIAFHDGLSWLMQITMFVTLGLLVFPSQLIRATPVALSIAVFLFLVARPLSVFISLFWTNYSLREKSFISWVGLRGAVPIVLAIAPITADLPGANIIFNVVFFVVLISISIQGLTLVPTARWLGLVNDL